MDYKEANETVGTANVLVNFGKAIEALKQGKRVQRVGWNGKGLFVFMQVPSTVPIDIVPKMTSLPQSVKDEFEKRNFLSDMPRTHIKYSNQLAIVNPDNSINGWTPSGSDALAEDWIILD
jgi:hypothetical protein